MTPKKRYKLSWKWIVLWSLWAARLVRQPTAESRVSSGLVRGSIANDGSHRIYVGIPYATVERRFRVPGPEPKWEGIFEAVDDHVHCHQKIKGIVTGQEDCLVINVYTPIDASPDDTLPVMVWIHGGGFFSGSGSRHTYGPGYLVAKNVILVTFNYRVNVQVFLCLGTKDAPGNAGMKDQVAALKWVQRNIKIFGGDVDNVTIFGESAGAVSVSLHLLSPMSKGLFHKAIAQSGSATTPWALQWDPLSVASLLAKAIGIETQNVRDMYDIFISKSDLELAQSEVPRPKGETVFSELIFVPCVENYVAGEESFLTDLPYNILSSGNYTKVPMIIGTNNEEGYFFTSFDNDKTLSMMDFVKLLPKDLNISITRERKEISYELKMMYMGDDDVSKDTILKFSRFVGEMGISYNSVQDTELLAATSDKPVYSYIFSYSGWRNFIKFSCGLSFALASGASHADDILYLFKPSLLPSFFENAMIDRLTTLWTNFAKTGDPAQGVWLPIQLEDPQTIELSTLEPRPLWQNPNLRYWRSLHDKFRKRRYYTFEENQF